MITLLDGGMGFELQLRGVKVPSHTESIWSALALVEDPESAQRSAATVLRPDAYAAEVQLWLEAGASIIGGCCGTRPKHIKRLKELLESGS